MPCLVIEGFHSSLDKTKIERFLGRLYEFCITNVRKVDKVKIGCYFFYSFKMLSFSVPRMNIKYIISNLIENPQSFALLKQVI